MTHKGRKVILFTCLYLVAIMVIASTVFATTVFSNSHIWQDKYLASVYAGQEDAAILTFQNLADAQLKIKTVPKDDPIFLYESTKKPVVKNFASVLSVNGYTDVTTVTYEDYVELQSIFTDERLSQNPDASIVVLDPDFGVEATSISPLIVKKKYIPLFLTADSKSDIVKLLNSQSGNIVAGKFPIRLVESLQSSDAEFITGSHVSNVAELTQQVLATHTSEWGVLMRPDMTDLSAISSENPIFLYFGSVEDTAENIKNSQVKNFEVIGGRLADTAQAIELESGRDLRFLLKYGRTVTQVAGMEGEILNIDSENFPFPFVDVSVSEAAYYEQNGKIAVTFENRGNLDAMIFSNIEFGTQALTDNFTYAIPKGEKITISYDVEPESVREITLSTQYGSEFPLTAQIIDTDGRTFVKKELVQKTSAPQTELRVDRIQLDTKEGILYVRIANLGDAEVQTHVQIPLTDELTVASKQVFVEANAVAEVEIPVPYVSNADLLDKEVRLVAFQGVNQPLYVTANISSITERTDFGGLIVIVIIVVLVVLIGSLLVVFFKRKGVSRPKSHRSSYKRHRR